MGGGGGIVFFIENPRRGGGFQEGKGPRGRKGGIGECLGGGGLAIFFFQGRNVHQGVQHHHLC